MGDTTIKCRCGACFPIHDGVIDIMGDKEGDISKTFSQTAMRFKPLIRIYDILWRHMTFPLVTSIPFSREVKIILGYHELNQGSSILDIACGPGTYTRRFAHAVGTQGIVIGVDASSPMLVQAARQARSEGLGNIWLIRASAVELPFQNEQFDSINCTGALHLFDSVEPVLGRVHAMLKPGGVFSCMTFCQSPVAPVNAAFQRLGVRLFDPTALKEMVHQSGLIFHHSTRSRLMFLFSAKKPVAVSA